MLSEKPLFTNEFGRVVGVFMRLPTSVRRRTHRAGTSAAESGYRSPQAIHWWATGRARAGHMSCVRTTLDRRGRGWLLQVAAGGGPASAPGLADGAARGRGSGSSNRCALRRPRATFMPREQLTAEPVNMNRALRLPAKPLNTSPSRPALTYSAQGAATRHLWWCDAPITVFCWYLSPYPLLQIFNNNRIH